MKKIWIGKRESDILTYNYFDISITFWGSNENNNYSFCTKRRIKDNYTQDFSNFVLEKLHQIMRKTEEIEIHFYNNTFAYKLLSIEPKIRKYIVNLNSQNCLNIVRHKSLSRVWLQNSVAVPEFACLSKSECQYRNLIKKFNKYTEFVIQKNFSGGGNGTFIINTNNETDIINLLDDNDVFLVSPYYDNSISLSCHLIIDNNSTIVFPISRQLLKYNNKISYCGNEFIHNNTLTRNSKKFALKIGERLRRINYRGICGLDLIFQNGQIYLIEINPRYQGSSYIINRALKENKLPSLFELNSMAFNGGIPVSTRERIKQIEIYYESHVCNYNSNTEKHKIIHPQRKSEIIFYDGAQNAVEFEDGVYLYRYLNKTE